MDVEASHHPALGETSFAAFLPNFSRSNKITYLLQSDRNAPFLQVFLRLPDGIFPEMEDRGGKSGIGLAFCEPVINVFKIPHTTRGDDWYRDRLGHSARERQVIAVLLSVLVHAREQYLASAVLLHLLCPCHGIDAHWFSAAMGVDLPF